MIRSEVEARPEQVELFGDGALGVAEAARFSGIGRTTLYELMSAGKLAYTKVGSRRLIPRRGLVALLAEQAMRPAG
jgi:excisionase family DNA binding protein